MQPIARWAGLTLLVGLVSAAGAAPPKKSPWPPKKLDHRPGPWGVYMVPQPSLDEGIPVAEADTKEKAEKIAEELWQRELKEGSFPHPTFVVRGPSNRNQADKEQPPQPSLTLPLPGGKKLTVPLSNVDPKPVQGSKPPAVNLEGRTAEGTIGEQKVTFQFKARHKLTIGGDLKGEGEWGLSDNNLIMTTRLSVFLGRLEGNKFHGKRVLRDGKGLKEWSATLGRPRAKDALIGTAWQVSGSHRRVGNGFGGTMTFAAEGKCVWKQPGREPINCTWSRDGNRVTINQDGKSGGPFVLVLAGKTMTGGNPDWKVTLTKQ